ncbi:MAG: hypothetical protein WBL29_05570 [Burkholderiales bacterium]
MADGAIHIYAARFQTATHYFVDLSDEKRKRLMWLHMSPHKLVRCCACHCLRRAKNCVVQVYYDGHRFSCRDGEKCCRGRRRK